MNEVLSGWINSTLANRIALTLVHFLWQGMLIAILVWLIGVVVRSKSANAGSSVFLGGLFSMAVCAVVTFVVMGAYVQRDSVVSTNESTTVWNLPTSDNQDNSVATDLSASTSETNALVTGDSSDIQPSTSLSVWQKVTPFIAAAYVFGVLILLGRLMLGLRGGWNLRRHSEPVDEASLLSMLACRARALGMRVSPALCHCRDIAVPTVVGILRPTILLPMSLVAGLSPDQLEAILTHELAHIRRYDHLVNIIQRIIEATLFFHPAVWWVSRRIRVERENCCDDVVLRLGAEPTSYAELLVEIAEHDQQSRPARGVALVAALQATGSRSLVSQRVRRLLGMPASDTFRLSRGGLVGILAIGVILLSATVALQATSGESKTAEDANARTSTDLTSAEIVSKYLRLAHPPGLGEARSKRFRTLARLKAHPKTAVAAVADALPRASAAQRAELAEVLRFFPSDESATILVKLLDDPKAKVRHNSVNILRLFSSWTAPLSVLRCGLTAVLGRS